MSCAHAFGDWCPECIENLVQKYNKLQNAAAEQREQLDAERLVVDVITQRQQEQIATLREQLQTLLAENDIRKVKND